MTIKNFLKNHKVAVVVSVIVVIVLIALFIVLMNGRSNETVSSSVVTEESVSSSSEVSSSDTKNYLSGITQAPDDNSESSSSSGNVIDFPNGEDNKPSESESTKPSEDKTSESSSSEDKTSESVKPSESNSSEDKTSESSSSEDKTSESVKPSETKPSESKPSEDKPAESSSETTPEDKPGNGGNSSSDASSFTGGNISLDNIGISIPTLDKFNKAGLTENDYWWGGKEGNLGIIDDNAGAIMNATGFGTTGSGGNGFTITEYYIEWAYASYSAVNDISLKRDTTNGYYVLEINTPLDVNYSGAAGGGDISPVSRDIVKFMLSCISSTPSTVYSKVYTFLHEDASVLYSDRWVTVGDCKMMADMANSSNHSIHILIKGN